MKIICKSRSKIMKLPNLRIILHDNIVNLPVVSQQPHLDPNYAPDAAVCLLAVA